MSLLSKAGDIPSVSNISPQMRPHIQGPCSDRMFLVGQAKQPQALFAGLSGFFVILSGNNVDLSLASQVASCLRRVPADRPPSGSLGHPGDPSLH